MSSIGVALRLWRLTNSNAGADAEDQRRANQPRTARRAQQS